MKLVAKSGFEPATLKWLHPSTTYLENWSFLLFNSFIDVSFISALRALFSVEKNSPLTPLGYKFVVGVGFEPTTWTLWGFRARQTAPSHYNKLSIKKGGQQFGRPCARTKRPTHLSIFQRLVNYNLYAGGDGGGQTLDLPSASRMLSQTELRPRVVYWYWWICIPNTWPFYNNLMSFFKDRFVVSISYFSIIVKHTFKFFRSKWTLCQQWIMKFCRKFK